MCRCVCPWFQVMGSSMLGNNGWGCLERKPRTISQCSFGANLLGLPQLKSEPEIGSPRFEYFFFVRSLATAPPRATSAPWPRTTNPRTLRGRPPRPWGAERRQRRRAGRRPRRRTSRSAQKAREAELGGHGAASTVWVNNTPNGTLVHGNMD